MRHVRVLSYEGAHDGLRWGEVVAGPGQPQHFTFDRLSGRVRLWRNLRSPEFAEEDTDPARIAAATAVILELEPCPVP
jgi:hypothetical protein